MLCESRATSLVLHHDSVPRAPKCGRYHSPNTPSNVAHGRDALSPCVIVHSRRENVILRVWTRNIPHLQLSSFHSTTPPWSSPGVSYRFTHTCTHNNEHAACPRGSLSLTGEGEIPTVRGRHPQKHFDKFKSLYEYKDRYLLGGNIETS